MGVGISKLCLVFKHIQLFRVEEKTTNDFVQIYHYFVTHPKNITGKGRSVVTRPAHVTL